MCYPFVILAQHFSSVPAGLVFSGLSYVVAEFLNIPNFGIADCTS